MALACLFFFAFVTMYGFIKVSPVLMDIGQKYGMGLDTVGNVMAFVTNLGSFYSGPFGAMADGMGWQQAGLVGLLPIAAVFTVLCLIFVKSERSILKKEEGQA